MKTRSLIAAASALTLAASPALAAPAVQSANPASSLSVARAATPSAGKANRLVGGTGAIVGLALAAAVVAGGIIIAVDDDDGPDSN